MIQPKLTPYHYGLNRRALRKFTDAKQTKEHTIEPFCCDWCYFVPGEWDQVKRGNQVFYRGEGYRVDGFLPDGAGLFGTRITP